MRIFAAQVEAGGLLITEFEVVFTTKTMRLQPGPRVPNFCRTQQPFSLADVEAGVLAVGLYRDIALATTPEQAVKTLCVRLELHVQQAQKALADAEARLRVALVA